MQAGDGRFDGERVVTAGKALAGRALFIDLARHAEEARTVISAVMFGAMAGTGVLPFTREQCAAAIRAGGVGVEGSLRGFDSGFAAAREPSPPAAPALPIAADGADLAAARAVRDDVGGSPLRVAAGDFDARIATLPAAAQAIVRAGVDRTLDYQDRAYAVTYLERVEALARVAGAAPELVRETARLLALWMSYEDIARVAQLKTKPDRFAHIRGEVRAAAAEPLAVIEYLRPGRSEIADMLPPAIARRVQPMTPGSTPAAAETRTGPGLHLRTTSISGYALLRVLSGLRAVRRRSSRFAREQAAINAWLAAIRAALAAGAPELAAEVVQAARFVKGYGDTHARGVATYERLMAIGSDDALATIARAAGMRAARESALRQPQDDIRPARPQPQTITLHRRPSTAAAAASERR